MNEGARVRAYEGAEGSGYDVLQESAGGSDVDGDRLDELYHRMSSWRKELDFVRPFLTAVSAIEAGEFCAAEEHLDVQMSRIVEFYERFFSAHPFLGDDLVAERPDVIVVLGGHRDAMDLRVGCGLGIAREFPESVVVFSGRGYAADETESDYM